MQNALELKRWYCVQRVPEPILYYKDEAKTQKGILLPIALCCNLNGDVFVLDKGASCVHVYNRGDIVKEHTIGKYQENSQSKLKPKSMQGRDLTFSADLVDMDIKDDNVYIYDGGKSQMIILLRCTCARKVTLSMVCYFDYLGNCSSMVCSGKDELVLLCKDDADATIINVLSVQFPKKSIETVCQYSVSYTFSPCYEVKGIFSCNILHCEFGLLNGNEEVLLFDSDDDTVKEHPTGLSSKMVPASSGLSLVILSSTTNMIELHTACDSYGTITFLKADIEFILPSDNNPELLSLWGNVINIVSNAPCYISLLEIGLLQFGVELCKAVQSFYRAIGYVPPPW